MSVTDRDLGWKAIKTEIARAKKMEVAVGILAGSSADGESIAEYAAYNEFGTKSVPARPFMAMSFDENVSAIDSDFLRQGGRLAAGKITAGQALTIVGQKHASRIQNTITGRDISPRLSPRTVAVKGSTKTLVDTGAMVNAVQISVRPRTRGNK